MLLRTLPVGTRSALHVTLELGGIKTRFFLLAHDRKLVDDPALSTPVNRRARSLRDTLAHQLMAGFTAQPADGVIHIRRLPVPQSSPNKPFASGLPSYQPEDDRQSHRTHES